MNKLLDALLMLVGVLMLGVCVAGWPIVVLDMWRIAICCSERDPFYPSAKELALGTVALPVWCAAAIPFCEYILFPIVDYFAA